MRTIRTAAVALVALAVALLGTSAGFAQEQPYPTGASAVLNKSAVAPGDNITCSASGFQAGTTITASLAGGGVDETQTVTADGSGNAVATFEVPADAQHGATVQCSLSGTDASGSFTRTAVASFTIDNTLPVTGGEFTKGGAIAAGIIILGATMVLIARRKSGVDVG